MKKKLLIVSLLTTLSLPVLALEKHLACADIGNANKIEKLADQLTVAEIFKNNGLPNPCLVDRNNQLSWCDPIDHKYYDSRVVQVRNALIDEAYSRCK
jgi:hypothetical protein